MIFVFPPHIAEFRAAVLKKLDTIIANQEKLLVQKVDDDALLADLVPDRMGSLEQLELFDRELEEDVSKRKKLVYGSL